MKEVFLTSTDSAYPAILRHRLGNRAPECLYVRGNVAALRARMLGLICSIQCPGSVVIKTFDAIRALREDGVVVIGGFHSPMERECLEILLRGEQPVILCPARTLRGFRLGERLRHALEAGQLLVLSPFDHSVRRTTVEQAMVRNQVVAAIADSIFIPHAAPSGKSWDIVAMALERGQRVYTVEDDENLDLMRSGAEQLPLPFTVSRTRSTCEESTQ